MCVSALQRGIEGGLATLTSSKVGTTLGNLQHTPHHYYSNGYPFCQVGCVVVRGLCRQSSGAYFLLGAVGMKKRDSQGLRFFECFHELPLADQRMAAVKKIVADNPLLSLFGMDNATDEEVTERTDSRFPLGQYSHKKKSIKGKCTVVPTALDTLFLMASG